MKAPNNGHRWTDQELSELMAKWLADDSCESIASHFSVTPHAIRKQIYRMRENGIPLPRRNAGNTAGRANQPWTQEEVEYVVRRRSDGITADRIAIEMDRSFSAIQGMIQRLRSADVPLRMLGSGARKLWSAEKLRETLIGRASQVHLRSVK